ncbi:dihydrodipicolinate synthase family protein [Geothrix limicola]|uniref:Dihydrodipicolinate synthase family protein n=1 Tax=Geothrix limicola TaxID=2927978 RepID=A0ABQ5QCD5_9BACT|nr:dihydrodipicolinate synthase family protein [Geothrix limicola]GLH71714.1 dihydrodipicolinate synthase family protein [Geothrix limicola]
MNPFQGVIPAITTPFLADDTVNFAVMDAHARWMLANGCSGLVPCGSLGEGATLSFDEKVEVIRTCVLAAGDKPVIAGIAALSTAEAVRLAKAAEAVGAKGLMVLPPYVYVGDWAEMRAHLDAVIDATPLPCLLYNNPVAYKVDFLPEQIAEMAKRHANLVAVKESSTDARRIAAIRALIGDRLVLGVGVDDCLMEGVAMGASFWIAGLVNAFPKESVELFELSRAGKFDEAFRLYAWFLPLLRMDTVPKFVQLIKLVQQEMGWGSERMRAPRAALVGAEREAALAVLKQAQATLNEALPTRA